MGHVDMWISSGISSLSMRVRAALHDIILTFPPVFHRFPGVIPTYPRTYPHTYPQKFLCLRAIAPDEEDGMAGKKSYSVPDPVSCIQIFAIFQKLTENLLTRRKRSGIISMRLRETQARQMRMHREELEQLKSGKEPKGTIDPVKVTRPVISQYTGTSVERFFT
jgi:hypothetical protein